MKIMLARSDGSAMMPLISKGIYLVLLRCSANLSSFKWSSSSDRRTADIDWIISSLSRTMWSAIELTDTSITYFPGTP
jgi:hypothetical protein